MVRTWPCLSVGNALTMRSTVAAAPFVCSVPITRMPISAAVTAMLIVSWSRNSPTSTTSGSSRRAECSASAKPGLCTPTSRWLTRQFLRGCTNSIGSSMVRMWPLMRVLMSSIIAASEVDLPEPVLPVTRIRPLFNAAEAAHRLGHVELVERERLGGDGAEYRAEPADVAEHVDAETRDAGNAVGEVRTVLLLEAVASPCAA